MSGKPQPVAPPIAAPDPTRHGIAIEFPDDHDINGCRIHIVGVTPEQIAIAIWNLERVANAAADARIMQRTQAGNGLDTGGGRGDLSPAELAKIARDPRGGLRQ